MPNTMRQPEQASHREQLADVHPKAAKADLHPQVGASRLRDVAADAIRSTSGNARAAAIDLNVHEGHLSRQLKDGSIRLEQLEVLGPAFAVKFGQELLERFGALATPQARHEQLRREIEQKLDEMRQCVELIA